MNTQEIRKQKTRLCIIVGIVALILTACAFQPKIEEPSPLANYQTVEPGTIENMGNPKMEFIVPAHDALKPAADEIVIYYYRNDGNYEPWGFWHWAIPGGDGALVWEKTKNLEVIGNVGYLRFKKDGSTFGVNVIGSSGMFGLIPRKDSAWEKDGDQDRIIDSRAGNEWVVFQGDQKTYHYGPYVPSIEAARLISPNEIVLDLSGRYGLSLEPGPSGFSVRYADGSGEIAVVDAVNNADPANRKNNYARRVKLTLGEEVRLDRPIEVVHPSFLAPTTVNTSGLAATMADNIVPPEGFKLGAIYDAVRKSVEFRLWSPFASRVTARLYRTSLASTADYSLDLAKDPNTGVWQGSFDSVDPDGFFYEYSVFFGNKENIVLDPYALSMDAFTGQGPGRGAIVDPAKAQPEEGWQGYTDYQLEKREDAIIYEISVRDFTIAPDAGTKARPGSFLAFVEKLPYLKELGVTHIQLMPVLNFYYNNELETAYEATGRANNNNYNWGYDPHNYFTPEGWFSSNPRDPYARMRELKTLIKEIHKAGMGVILDVVYNHTATPSILDDIVPGYYYRRDAKGDLTNNSGCGNDVATEREMASRLICDSLYYLADEYKVDGFRFDLMGLIDVNTLLKARAAISAIPGKEDILFEGEGWKMYHGPALTVMNQDYMTQTNEVSVFNDEFRDILKGGGLNDRTKGLVTGRPVNTSLVFNNLAGRPMLYYKADDPGDSMNYVSAHDNLTLADNIAFNVGLSPKYPEERAEIAARAKLANFFVLTGQPIAFLHGGCERGRSKPKLNSTSEVIGEYVHNSYDASDDINQFPWTVPSEYAAMAEWVKGLIAIRKAEPGLHIGDAATISSAMKQIPHSDQLSMGWTVNYGGTTLAMLVNANFDTSIDFDVGIDLSKAVVLVDADEASPQGVSKPSGIQVSGTKATVAPLTAVMLKLLTP